MSRTGNQGSTAENKLPEAIDTSEKWYRDSMKKRGCGHPAEPGKLFKMVVSKVGGKPWLGVMNN